MLARGFAAQQDAKQQRQLSHLLAQGAAAGSLRSDKSLMASAATSPRVVRPIATRLRVSRTARRSARPIRARARAARRVVGCCASLEGRRIASGGSGNWCMRRSRSRGPAGRRQPARSLMAPDLFTWDQVPCRGHARRQACRGGASSTPSPLGLHCTRGHCRVSEETLSPEHAARFNAPRCPPGLLAQVRYAATGDRRPRRPNPYWG
jgi:hypothetical protein